MKVEIINKQLTLDIYGFSEVAVNEPYSEMAFKLMDKMWKVLKGRNLPNNGLNIWIYETDQKVFAGVELKETPSSDTDLERKTITLDKYAYFKHVGPYSRLKQTKLEIHEELKGMEMETVAPYIEIYGHWNSDESKLETELIHGVR